MKVSENKPHSIHLRLTEDQYKFLKNDADFIGVGVSEYIRMLVNMSINASKNLSKKLDEQLGDLGHEDKQNNIERQL